jgi:hypothetical protein
MPRKRGSWFAGPAELRRLATRVSYVGSPEHKNTPSFAGQPRPRADASLCPQELKGEKAKVEGWLRQAISKGAVSELREGDFPRYVWFQDGDAVYEGRLVNQQLGQYKGYPLESDEVPAFLGEIYA